MLHKSQYAFIPGIGSATPVDIIRNVYEISNERLRNPDTNGGSAEVHIAYLDIKRAYDSIDFLALNISLRAMGLPESVITLMTEIDKGAEILCRTPHGFSNPAPVGRGCRQGDSFSCLRFNAWMNGLLLLLDTSEHGWKLNSDTTLAGQLFADDSAIISGSNKGLQELVCLTNKYFTTFGVDVNTTKSFYTTNSKDPPTDIYYTSSPIPLDKTNCQPLQYVEPTSPVKYLGFLMSFDLTWQAQADHLTTKITQATANLSRAAVSPHEAVTALNAVISGKLAYIFQVASFSPKQLTIWDKMLLKVVRAKTPAGVTQPNIHIVAHRNDGGLGLILPSHLYHYTALSEFYYRLGEKPGSISAKLTWHRLKQHTAENNFTACALRFPRKIVFNKSTTYNHVTHISHILAKHKLTMDTDAFLLNQNHTEWDVELMAHMAPIDRRTLGPALSKHKLFYLSQVCNPSITKLTPWTDLSLRLRIKRKARPDWYRMLQHTFAGAAIQNSPEHLTALLPAFRLAQPPPKLSLSLHHEPPNTENPPTHFSQQHQGSSTTSQTPHRSLPWTEQATAAHLTNSVPVHVFCQSKIHTCTPSNAHQATNQYTNPNFSTLSEWQKKAIQTNQ